MKKRIKVLVMITSNHYEEIEVEEFNDLFWFYSCKWKNNLWLKEKYGGIFDYALVDKKTGMHVKLTDSLKEINVCVEKTIETYKMYINNNFKRYSFLVDIYNDELKEKYNYESKNTNL